MAVNETRNLSRDLREGLTDGVVKKRTPDRGGEPESYDLYCEHVNDQYGARFSEITHKELADRLNDGKLIGEADQDTQFTWYDTPVPRNTAYPSV